jgi:hypothetical protein
MSDVTLPEDVTITVGIGCVDDHAEEFPVIVMHYDKNLPPTEHVFRRYRKLILEMGQADTGGFKYYIASDVTTTPPSEAHTRFDGTSPEEISRTFGDHAPPEFSASVKISAAHHELFVKAREAQGGCWTLVVLTSVGTEVFVGADDTIRSIGLRPRDDYRM